MEHPWLVNAVKTHTDSISDASVILDTTDNLTRTMIVEIHFGLRQSEFWLYQSTYEYTYKHELAEGNVQRVRLHGSSSLEAISVMHKILKKYM